jgi:hypothetical protein
MDLTSIGKKLTDATTALAKADKDLKLEMAGAAADAAGIIDPSPASDIVGAGISIARGDYWGTALSTASMVPYVGDLLAKPAKAVRATKAIAGLEKKVAALTKTVTDLKKAKKEAEAVEAAAKEVKIAREADVAKDAASKQEKSATKKEKDCEDCGSTGDNKTKSIVSVNRAGSKYGGIPAEHQSRYDKYLSGPSVKKLTPDACESAKRAWKNNADGNAFETSARKALKAPLGPGSKPISIQGYIPDLPIGKKYGVTDVKNIINLSNDDQLRAFSKYALENKLPFNSIIGPRTQSISEPLLDGIRQTGGKVIRFDPTTGQFKNIDIGLSGPWKK